MRLGDVRRILVLNRNHIGDCLLTTPMLRALKRRYPRAKLCVAVPASNVDLLVTNPHVDEIVPRPKTSSWAAKFRFASDVRAGNYDLIISLQEKSTFYAWATWFAALFCGRRTVTVGLENRRTQRFYHHSIPVRLQHEVYKYLDIAEALGCPRERNPVLELVPTEAAQARVESFLHRHGFESDTRFIAVNPGGTKDEKRWPVERFAEVGDRLSEKFNLPVIVLGGPGDRDRAHTIADRMSRPASVAAGWASLADTAALLERCELLVTGDTGPMHMAVALAVPVVSIFGPTNPVKFAPFTKKRAILRHDEPCEECREMPPGKLRRKTTSTMKNDPKLAQVQLPCLHTVTVDEVVEAAGNLYTAPPIRRMNRDHHR